MRDFFQSADRPPRGLPVRLLSLGLCVMLGLTVASDTFAATTAPAAIRALAIARQSPSAVRGMAFLGRQARAIQDPALRAAALGALDPNACVRYRAGLSAMQRQQVVDGLVAGGWLKPQDHAAVADIFPNIKDEDGNCPRIASPMLAAPGGNSGSHHDWPGGLVTHEAFNLGQALGLARLWHSEQGTAVDLDLLRAAIIWHDWGKTLVFQWNEDGTEPEERQIAGTGAHHIIGLAEAMSRGLPARLIRTMACAHAAPADGQEAQVAGWLSAAAVIARVDARGRGYLDGAWPPECFIHTLSDQNWIVSDQSSQEAEHNLARLAGRYGLTAGTSDYNWRLRLPALARFGALKLWKAEESGDDDALSALTDKIAQPDPGPRQRHR